eukprot:6085032-Amphidinium_carterae.1
MLITPNTSICCETVGSPQNISIALQTDPHIPGFSSQSPILLPCRSSWGMISVAVTVAYPGGIYLQLHPNGWFGFNTLHSRNRVGSSLSMTVTGIRSTGTRKKQWGLIM